MVDQAWAFVAGLWAVSVPLGWTGVVGVLIGMGVYHQMLKRWPALLGWLLSGVKQIGKD